MSKFGNNLIFDFIFFRNFIFRYHKLGRLIGFHKMVQYHDLERAGHVMRRIVLLDLGILHYGFLFVDFV